MTVICKLSDLAEGHLTPAMLGRAPILVTLVRGEPRAVAARCPHQGADLQAGCLVGRVSTRPDGAITVDPARPVLRCPWHGFEYDLATGDPLVQSPAHRRMRLRTYTVRVQAGDVVIDA